MSPLAAVGGGARIPSLRSVAAAPRASPTRQPSFRRSADDGGTARTGRRRPCNAVPNARRLNGKSGTFAATLAIALHGSTRSLVGSQQFDQSLIDRRLSVRLGQNGVLDEVMITRYGGLFLNSSLTFRGMPSVDLPSGCPLSVGVPVCSSRSRRTDPEIGIGRQRQIARDEGCSGRLQQCRASGKPSLAEARSGPFDIPE